MCIRDSFKDFEGDTLDRNFRDAINKDPYVDTSGRNDITDVMVTHDGQNLYIKVTAAEEITDPEGENWMNVLIKTDEDLANSFAGYEYIVNRHPDGTVTSVERSTGGYEWETDVYKRQLPDRGKSDGTGAAGGVSSGLLHRQR